MQFAGIKKLDVEFWEWIAINIVKYVVIDFTGIDGQTVSATGILQQKRCFGSTPPKWRLKPKRNCIISILSQEPLLMLTLNCSLL